MTETFESTLGSVPVLVRKKDGFINATKLCKDHGKRFGNWYQLDSSQRFLQQVDVSSKEVQIDQVEICTTGENDARGTWVHPRVAVQIVNWIGLGRCKRSLIGVVYLAAPSDWNRVKIGMWTGDLSRLRSRYATFYGEDLELICWECGNALELETAVHQALADYHISREIFHRDGVPRAREFLRTATGHDGEVIKCAL